MSTNHRGIVAPLLFSAGLGSEEQRVYFRRRFEGFRKELAACRAEAGHRFTVDDLQAFLAFFDTACEDRAALRKLITAGRVSVSGYGPPEVADPLVRELWRRNTRYGRQAWEEVLGGAPPLEVSIPGVPVELSPAMRRLVELLLSRRSSTPWPNWPARAGLRPPSIARGDRPSSCTRAAWPRRRGR